MANAILNFHFDYRHTSLIVTVFRVGLKVDLVPIVGHTGPPKVRRPRYLGPKQVVFMCVFFVKIGFFFGQMVDSRL